ncbi:hypothetical protein [Yinghuangia soli]|nr:hypothetical protein [Yinghuangia soli]
MSRLFLPGGNVHVVEPQLPEDEPFKVRHDTASRETILLVRHKTPGSTRTNVVPTTYRNAKELFQAAADFERSSVQLGRIATIFQNLLVTEYGVPESELEKSLDAVLADLYADESAHAPSQNEQEQAAPPAAPPLPGTESRIALLIESSTRLADELDLRDREALASQVAEALGCAPTRERSG